MATAIYDELGFMEHATCLIGHGCRVLVLEDVPHEASRSGLEELRVLTSKGQVVRVRKALFA